jgi:hypothetical protein
MPANSEGLTVKARLNLKLDNDLKDWAMEYASSRGTTVTRLICDFFCDLRKEECRAVEGELVEQL